MTGNAMTPITQAKFARIANVNRSSVNRAIKNGRLEAENGRVLVKVLGDTPESMEQAVLELWAASGSAQPHHQARLQQINEEKAARQSMKNAIDSSMSDDDEDDESETLGNLNLRIKRADAMKRENEARTSEINRKALEGEYLLRESVAYALRDHTSVLREKMENLADRLTPVIFPLETAEETRTALAEAAESILRDMHESMQRAMELARESK